MTPGFDWRKEYGDRPTALGKLQLVGALVAEVGAAPPLVTNDATDEDVATLAISLADFYRGWDVRAPEAPPGLDGSLQAVFARASAGERRAATALIKRLEPTLCTEIFRWTGHFPERTRPLVRQLAERAAAMQLDYPVADEPAVTVALTALVTALAMNHVHRGSYLP
jgi:hypothetical protein